MDLTSARILVTGADGFIGSHLTEALVARGAKVRALSLYNSFNSWGWLDRVECLKDIEVVTGDIRDPNLVETVTREIDVVFHLAALIAIPYSYVAPDSYVQTNVGGTLNVVQSALKNGVKRVVHTSTSEVYGTAKFVPIDETHPMQPQSPYSASKIGADAMALSFYYTYGLPVVVARPFNTFGPRQSARAVIPTIISQILSGLDTLKLGALTPTRDLNYVANTCAGLMALAECDRAVGEQVNIGSGTEISVGDLAQTIKGLIGSKVEIVEDQQRTRPKASEVERLVCDASKLFALTGFKPDISLEDGLSRTIAWFSNKKNLELYKAGLYNV